MNKQNKYTIANTQKQNPYLEYFSKFSELSNHAKSLEHISDGVFLLELIQQIKHVSLVGDVIDAPKTFSHRLSNIKVIFKSIDLFWTQSLGVEVEGDMIDLVEIGRTGNVQQMQKLLQLIVKTAVQAENKKYFIEKVLLTSQLTQQFLMKIIEKFKNEILQSPRKEREKRMYDKILQLDHQNDKLYTVLEEICDEKLSLEQKVKILSEKLQEKTRQLQYIEMQINEEAFTPRKKGMMSMPDTSDRKDNLIDSLKAQITEMSVLHERQIQSIYLEFEKISVRNEDYEKMKNQLALSREIIESHKQFRAMTQQMQLELSQSKAENMSKQNHINYMKEKLQKSNRAIVELETSLTSYKGEFQRKNIQIGELIAKLDDIERKISPRKGDSSSNLYLDFPGIINTEAEAYIETNRNLREELERTRQKLEESQFYLNNNSAQLESLRGCEAENRKLRDMVIELNTYRGQQNEILVSSLFHLRKIIQSKIG